MMAGSFLAGERRSKRHVTHTKNNSNRMGEILAVEGGAGSRSADGGGRIIVRNFWSMVVFCDSQGTVAITGIPWLSGSTGLPNDLDYLLTVRGLCWIFSRVSASRKL